MDRKVAFPRNSHRQGGHTTAPLDQERRADIGQMRSEIQSSTWGR